MVSMVLSLVGTLGCHVRHVDLELVQLLLVGCSHLHHSRHVAADLVTLVLSLYVERHDVEGNTVIIGAEAAVAPVSSWHGKTGCHHVACVPILCQRYCPCDKIGLLGSGEMVLQVDQPATGHYIPVEARGYK